MSLLRLNELSGKFLLLGYGGVRRSPSFDGVWEVACVIADLDKPSVNPTRTWTPLSDIGRYSVGSLLGSRPGKLTTDWRRVRLERFELAATSSEGREDLRYKVELYQPRNTVEYDWDERTAPMFYGNDHAGAVIDARELFRFYCGSVGLLAAPLLEAVHTETAPLDVLVNPRETGWDGDRFVIAPRRSFCGTGSVLQLALALSDPAFHALISTGLYNVKRTLAEGGLGVMTMAPRGPLDLVVEAEMVDHSVGGKPPRKILAVRRIISDLRQPTFRELVVKYPFAAYRDHDRALAMEDDPAPDEQGREVEWVVTPDTRLNRNELPSLRTFRVGSLGGRFSSAFPSWRGAKIRYDHAPPPRPSVTTLRERTTKIDAVTASTSPGTAAGRLVRVIHAPTGERGLDPGPPRPRLPTRFMGEEPTEFLEPRIVPAGGLSLMMRTFLRAGIELLGQQDWRYSPNVPGLGGEALVYVLPPSWGGLARVAPDGRYRRMAALPLNYENGFVWAVEIERRSAAEQFAIGLVAAHADVADEVMLLNGVMREVSRRWGRMRGDDPRGTWPDADYLDVKLGSVIHSRSRAHHVNLASALHQHARYLLRPSSEP